WALETPCAGSDAVRPGAAACTEVRPHLERIDVAGADPDVLEVRETAWGPVLHELADGRLLSLRWTAHLPGAVNLALAGFARVGDLDAALALADRTGIPTQNLVLGDRSGAIAWRLLGPLPVRAAALHPTAPPPVAAIPGPTTASPATARQHLPGPAGPSPPSPTLSARPLHALADRQRRLTAGPLAAVRPPLDRQRPCHRRQRPGPDRRRRLRPGRPRRTDPRRTPGRQPLHRGRPAGDPARRPRPADDPLVGAAALARRRHQPRPPRAGRRRGQLAGSRQRRFGQLPHRPRLAPGGARAPARRPTGAGAGGHG